MPEGASDNRRSLHSRRKNNVRNEDDDDVTLADIDVTTVSDDGKLIVI